MAEPELPPAREVPDLHVLSADPTSATSPRRTTSARGWGEFRRLWMAHSVSIGGDQLTLVALPVATYAETSSAVAVGVVASAEAVTALLFGLVAGALSDRLPRRPVLVLTDLARGVALVGLCAALLAPGSALTALIVAALVLGVTRVLHDAAAAAAIPLVVESPDLLAANGRLQASEATATAVGPALAGGLMSLGGPVLAFAADAASFFVAGLALRRVRRLDRHDRIAPGRGPRSLGPQIREGLRALLADGPMVQVVVLMAATNVVSVSVEAQFIPYAREVLSMGSLGIGAYFALGGLAAVATSFAAGRYQAARGDVIEAGLAVFAAGVLVAGVLPSHLTVAVAFVGAGVGSALVMTHATALRQRRFPVELQGRLTMAVRTVILGILPVPLIGGGWLAGRAGPQALFVVTASVGLGAALWGVLIGVGRLRED